MASHRRSARSYVDFPTLKLILRQERARAPALLAASTSTDSEGKQVISAACVGESRDISHAEAGDMRLERMRIVIRDERYADLQFPGEPRQERAIKSAQHAAPAMRARHTNRTIDKERGIVDQSTAARRRSTCAQHRLHDSRQRRQTRSMRAEVTDDAVSIARNEDAKIF